MTYSLEVKNLKKNLSSFKLDDISFNIPKGSIVGLIGENGAGKTTTIKSILNIKKRDGGKILFWDKDLNDDEISIKEDLGIVMDGDFLHENLNPLDMNKIFKSVYKNWDEKVFFSYMDKFNLPKDKAFKDYSKGMKVKLSISSALSHRAKLIILDEPTSGLDPIIRVEILNELQNFILDGEASVLFSTHITSDLDKIADYIVFLHEGSLVFSKDREELLTDYGIVRTNLEDLNKIPRDLILKIKKDPLSTSVLIKDRSKISNNFIVDKTSTEEIMLFFIKGEDI